jgi:hypothetical protein
LCRHNALCLKKCGNLSVINRSFVIEYAFEFKTISNTALSIFNLTHYDDLSAEKSTRFKRIKSLCGNNYA